MLNSFWGKFGMRDTLSKTEFVCAPKRYYDLMRSKANKIHDVHILSVDCVMVTHWPDEDYNEGKSSSNLPIAAMTTSYARLRLLKMLRQLDSQTLYFLWHRLRYLHQQTATVGTTIGKHPRRLG